MQMTLTSFNNIPPHEPPFQASSSPLPRIGIWPIPKYLLLAQRPKSEDLSDKTWTLGLDQEKISRT